jgi:hypothetical protein
MAFRRRTSFRRVARRKPRTQWVRFFQQVSAPTTPFRFDALSDYRTQMGILMNPPDTVVWRTFLTISAIFTSSSTIAGDGIHISMYNEDITPPPIIAAVAQPYAERYLIWKSLYLTQQIQESSTQANQVIFHEFDVKAKRKLQNQNETFYFEADGIGNLTAITSLSFSYSMLLRFGN